jgi:subtilisin family serine protease
MLLVAWAALAHADSSPADGKRDKISAWAWDETAGDARTELLVVLAEQADLRLARDMDSKQARGRWVYQVLWEQAQRSQAPLRRWLDARGVAYHSYYIVNLIHVLEADRALLEALAARQEVARITANPRVWNPELPPSPVGQEERSSTSIEWNVLRVNADDVWAMGYTGRGVVVGGQDTGYDWDHPALVGAYRGWDGADASHDYNWHDAIHDDDPHTATGNPCGFDSPEPCDDNSHGTHTMGIVLGDDGGSTQIGVAPGAQWIGCRNMEQGWGTPATYLECFEFFLAPYPVGGGPEQGNPDLAPDVTNNSWSCPASEGCDWATLQAAVETQRAAGILTVVSAGNDGSLGCSSIGVPPALYDAAYTVGSTDADDDLSSFSSRGPVTVDESGRLKPDIVAPGRGIRSSLPGGSYGTKQGTSMAAPHVAGAAALLWSAVPQLSYDLNATESYLNSSADPISSTLCSSNGVPNNLYGWGLLDIHAAVQAAQADLGHLTGQVTASADSIEAGEPISGSLIQVSGGSTIAYPLISDTDGRYTADLITSTYSLTVSAAGYQTRTVPGIVVERGMTTTQAISLTCTIWGSMVWEPAMPSVRERVTFSATVVAGTPPITYSWDIGNREAPLLGNPVSHVFPHPGTYTVTLTMDNACPGEVVIQRPIKVRFRNLFYFPLVMREVGT